MEKIRKKSIFAILAIFERSEFGGILQLFSVGMKGLGGQKAWILQKLHLLANLEDRFQSETLNLLSFQYKTFFFLKLAKKNLCLLCETLFAAFFTFRRFFFSLLAD